jgi:HAD superfamily hydrolase (TIGR01509 family)
LNKVKIDVDAVMFDLDGTILDSIHIYYQIIETVFNRLDLPLPPRDKLREAAKTGDFEWGRVFPKNTPEGHDRLIEKTRRIIAEIYPNLFRTQAKLIPNAKKSLEAIFQKGIKMGIVTSTPRQSMAVKLHPLEDSGINGLLEVIIHADDAPRKKPAPDPLLEGSKRLGIPPERCMYVGDARTDIQAGKAAGMKTIGVLTGFDDHKALSRENPDSILESIAQLPKTIC